MLYKKGGIIINLTIDKLIENIKKYNNNDLSIIKKAYDYAALMHQNQVRNSGEPYIIHPLNVAYILSEMHADINTICAGLLHDTIEDTKTTKEDIIELFNSDIANLVDGVTKMGKMKFFSKTEMELANTRKILTSLENDIRIIIIKLADRLHNMRTLEFKSEFKQKEIALETLDIYAPLAHYLGAYRIKTELEDTSFMYLCPNEHRIIGNYIGQAMHDRNSCIAEMLKCINEMLNDENMTHEIKVRLKNAYGVYKSLKGNINNINDINEMHDLISLKIMVDEIKNCYLTLGLIHSKYNPLNNKFKDYIYNPKINLYRSIHTTVFGPQEKLVQTQIRTFEMDKMASFGITAYWDIEGINAKDIMQEELHEKFAFYKSLTNINSMFKNNHEFVSHVKSEILSESIYVYAGNGEMVELPRGSSVIDLAYKLDIELGNKLIGATINNKTIDDIGYILNDGDVVKIITDENSIGPNEEWINKVRTSYAKSKIKEYIKK